MFVVADTSLCNIPVRQQSRTDSKVSLVWAGSSYHEDVILTTLLSGIKSKRRTPPLFQCGCVYLQWGAIRACVWHWRPANCMLVSFYNLLIIVPLSQSLWQSFHQSITHSVSPWTNNLSFDFPPSDYFKISFSFITLTWLPVFFIFIPLKLAKSIT